MILLLTLILGVLEIGIIANMLHLIYLHITLGAVTEWTFVYIVLVGLWTMLKMNNIIGKGRGR